MELETALTWSWLNVLTKKRYDALLEAYSDLDEALRHMSEPMLRALGCREETISQTLNRLGGFDAGAYERNLLSEGIEFLSLEDPKYPAMLLEVPDAPVFLYAKGSLEILNQPCIAIVGTRNMSAYGKRVIEDIVPQCVYAGLCTVSGLAIGIDAQVARETLSAGGNTIAVLAHGLASIHPSKHAQLAESIVGGGGLLLSEFPLDVQPDKYMFPARNRIIAGMSVGTVIAEAGEGSGALITAELALEYGRDVFAVPGQMFDAHYRGCHQLIARGHAKLITGALDIIQELGIAAPAGRPQKKYVPENDIEYKLYSALSTMPQSVPDIVERTDLDAATTNALLTVLELRGVVKNTGGGMWVRA